MQRRFRPIAGAVLLLVLTGCNALFGARGLPADPLFAHRKAIESKPISGPPQDVPHSGPTPPVNSYVTDPRFTSAK